MSAENFYLDHTTAAAKRKSISATSDSEHDFSDDELDHPSKKGGNSKSSASQQLVPVPSKPNAPMVTKRTLQNRKAQREFRKRREAKVKELEERCRRYDQLGVEANLGLQQIAKTLKQENEALKSLLVHLGFGNMIQAALEGINSGEPSYTVLPQQQRYPSMDLSMASWARGSDAVDRSALINNNKVEDAESKTKKRTSSKSSSRPATSQPIYTSMPIGGDSVNPSLLSDNTKSNQQAEESSQFNNEWFARLAQAGHSDDDSDTKSSASQSTPSSLNNNANPILSLNFGSGDQGSNNQQRGSSNKPSSDVQTRSTVARQFFGLDGSPSGGLSGSAMLSGLSGPQQRDYGIYGLTPFGMGPTSSAPGNSIFPVLSTHQNDALLNPNPIPFAFNLSNPKSPPDQRWWNQVGGGQLSPGGSNFLDEKAQAVAQATSGPENSTQSPFDLSAFLTGGITLGGGFNLGSHAAPSNNDAAHQSQDSEDSLGKSKGTDDGSNNFSTEKDKQLTPAEHAQMFLRLLEGRMKKRSTSPYALLGFQSPSQVMQQRNNDEVRSSASSSDEDTSPPTLKLSSARSFSPINIYSRLAQHPAFLSTNATELEELVDSIATSKVQAQQQQQRKFADGNALYGPQASGLSLSLYAQPKTASYGTDVEVVEKAVNKILGLLDQKSPRGATYTFQ